MTKEQYLVIRNLPEIPMETWYEFYVEKEGILQFLDFERMFVTFLWNNSITSNLKKIDFNTALTNFYNYYNEKFGV